MSRGTECTHPPTSRKLAGLPPCKARTSMVAIAKPAPLTKHPILPSSLMKFRFAFWASTSEGSSWVMSRRAKMSFCRNSALSSKPNLASILQSQDGQRRKACDCKRLYHKTCPSDVSAKGLISICVASLSLKILYRLMKMSAASP